MDKNNSSLKLFVYAYQHIHPLSKTTKDQKKNCGINEKDLHLQKTT